MIQLIVRFWWLIVLTLAGVAAVGVSWYRVRQNPAYRDLQPRSRLQLLLEELGTMRPRPTPSAASSRPAPTSFETEGMSTS